LVTQQLPEEPPTTYFLTVSPHHSASDGNPQDHFTWSSADHVITITGVNQMVGAELSVQGHADKYGIANPKHPSTVEITLNGNTVRGTWYAERTSPR
jgi:hypothetical protein